MPFLRDRIFRRPFVAINVADSPRAPETSAGPLAEDERRVPGAAAEFRSWANVVIGRPAAMGPRPPPPLEPPPAVVVMNAPLSDQRHAELIRQMMKHTALGVIVGALLMPVLFLICYWTTSAEMKKWCIAWLVFAAGSIAARWETERHWRNGNVEEASDAEVLRFIKVHRWAWLYSATAWGLAAGIFYGNVPIEMQFICWTLVAGSATWANSSVALCRPLQRMYMHAIFVVMFACAILAHQFETLKYPVFAMWFLTLPLIHWLALSVHAKVSLTYAIEGLDRQSELKQQRLVAEEAVSIKNRFLASAAHDMRQPILALRLMADTIAQSDSIDEVRSIAPGLRDGANAVNDLFDSLFDLAKLDTGETRFSISQVDIVELAQEVLERYRPVAFGRSQRMRMRGSLRQHHVMSDRVHLLRMVSNLVTNAIKYTLEGGTVVLALKEDDRGVAIEVWDTGIGIPEAQQATVFQEFVKLDDQAHTGTRDGFGLGLAIVARLSVALNHPVTLRSKYGKGSIFRIVLRDADQDHANSLMGSRHTQATVGAALAA